MGAETRPAGAEDDQRGAETRPVSPLGAAVGGGNAPSVSAASIADTGGGGNTPTGIDVLRKTLAAETLRGVGEVLLYIYGKRFANGVQGLGGKCHCLFTGKA